MIIYIFLISENINSNRKFELKLIKIEKPLL